MVTNNEKRRQPSMADVGRLADVSAQTVSRYFTGGYLSDEARQRVEDAVSQLGYRRNRLPQSLRRNRTDMIGYLNIGPANYGSSSILAGISRAAAMSDQSLLTTQLDLDPLTLESTGRVRHALEVFLSLRVDGVVIGSPYRGIQRDVELLAKSTPVVILSDRWAGTLDSVRADSHGTGRLAVEHLASLGHTRILHLSGPLSTNEATERLRGYRDTMTALGLTPLPHVECDSWTAAAGAEAIRRHAPTGFTAVYAGNDLLALGFISEMTARGLRCPDDYSIVGVDDSPDTAYYNPPLTTARIDFERLGEVACETILARIADGGPPQHLTIGTSLTMRGSTAQAKL